MPWNYKDRLQEPPPTTEDRPPRPDAAERSGLVDSDRDSSKPSAPSPPSPPPSVPAAPPTPPPLPIYRWPASRGAAVLNESSQEGQPTPGLGSSPDLPPIRTDPAARHAPPVVRHPT